MSHLRRERGGESWVDLRIFFGSSAGGGCEQGDRAVPDELRSSQENPPHVRGPQSRRLRRIEQARKGTVESAGWEVGPGTAVCVSRRNAIYFQPLAPEVWRRVRAPPPATPASEHLQPVG